MKISAERQKSIHYRFDAFCKKAMRYEARNCYKEISRKQQREVSLDHLIEEHFFAPRSVDDYFIVQSMQDISTSFRINGQIVTVENEYLAAALLHLSAEKRELILLHYFLGLTMQDITVLHNRAARIDLTIIAPPTIYQETLLWLIACLLAHWISLRARLKRLTRH